MAMSIKDFFNRENLPLLLELPPELRRKIFSETSMDLREKYVLANLYYLDSRNKLDEYKQLLPAMADLNEEQCLESIRILEEKGLLVRKGHKLILKIKPLTY